MILTMISHCSPHSDFLSQKLMSAKNIEFRLGLVYIYCDCVKHVIVRFGVYCNSKSSITFEIAMLSVSVIYHISAYLISHSVGKCPWCLSLSPQNCCQILFWQNIFASDFDSPTIFINFVGTKKPKARLWPVFGSLRNTIQ